MASLMACAVGGAIGGTSLGRAMRCAICNDCTIYEVCLMDSAITVAHPIERVTGCAVDS